MNKVPVLCAEMLTFFVLGLTWAFTIAIICLSFSGKFGGCTLAARLSGFGWREASTIGSLMSCKGYVFASLVPASLMDYDHRLVELIVLNVGLEAGILSPRVFSMFVLEALTLTFLTTPLVSALYPHELRVRASDLPGKRPVTRDEDGPDRESPLLAANDDWPWRYRFTVVLDKLEHVPGVLALTQLVLPKPPDPSAAMSVTSAAETIDLKKPEVVVNALRLIELSDRTSAVMKSSVADTLKDTDPLLGIFRMFGELNDLPVSTSLSVVPYEDLPHSVADHAARHASQLILLPWLPSTSQNPMEGDLTNLTPKASKYEYNPFEAFFGSLSKGDKSGSTTHSQFVRGVFAQSKSDVALFIDTGDRSGAGGSHHVFLPFFGGPDDRLALEFVVQLCLNPKMTATVVRYIKRDAEVPPLERPENAYLGDMAQVPSLPFPLATPKDHTIGIQSVSKPAPFR